MLLARIIPPATLLFFVKSADAGSGVHLIAAGSDERSDLQSKLQLVVQCNVVSLLHLGLVATVRDIVIFLCPGTMKRVIRAIKIILVRARRTTIFRCK